MRFAAFLAALPLLLASCARTTDNFAPRIVVTSPSSGGVSQTRTPMVKGYVLDDVGVTRITVDGQSIPSQSGTTKIVNFQFQAKVEGSSASYRISAFDAAGHESKLTLPVSVDNVKPTISIKSFERTGRNIRVSGVALDNVQIAQVTVDGNRQNISPGQRVEFFGQTTGIYADVEVLDSAGNRAFVRVQ